MKRAIERGQDAGFTVDGPRGPRYVAKSGPVLLARKTGAPIFCFHVSFKRKIQLNSWDHFQIPLPFTPAVILAAEPIWAHRGGIEVNPQGLRSQVQQVLDDLREKGDSWW
jgi:lysophospholipid acyltransferase (LPLAT)-like uncharacterized protein